MSYATSRPIFFCLPTRFLRDGNQVLSPLKTRLINCAQEHSVSKGPENETNRRSGEGGSDPIQWQKNDGGEERPREGRDIETDTEGESGSDSSRP